MKSVFVLLAILLALSNARQSAFAQIAVGLPGVGPINFTTQPAAGEWFTRTVPGIAGDVSTPAGLDAQVQTNSASLFSLPLVVSAGNPATADGLAVWSSAGFLQTRPTGNSFTLLMASLRNTSGLTLSVLNIGYDFTAVAPTAEQVAGHRVYYSFTGTPGDWLIITNLSGAVSGRLTNALNVGAWTNTAALYLLWADDNGSGAPDTACQIDNFSVSVVTTTPVITVHPQSQSVPPGENVSFSVTALGAAPLSYQWRKNSNDLSGATNQILAITNAQPADAGFYSVVVSNAYGTATSTDAVLTVACLDSVNITTQPQNQTVQSGTTLALSVAAGGTQPLRYQWFRDGAAISTATNQGYNKPGALPADSGSYKVVVSNCLGAVTSSVVTVWIYDPPYLLFGLTNQFWKYEQSGADLGTAWRETGFDDSAWPSGRAVLAVEDNALIRPLTNTVLSLTGTNGLGSITYYFRTHFTVTNAPAALTLISSNLIDDGAVAYLNGVEVFRFNMPATPITAATGASAVLAEGVFFTTNFAPGLYLQGDNVLAVEVHQINSVSSDIVFGMALIAQYIPPGPPVIQSQPAGLALFPGQDVTLSVSASSGTAVGYQWFQNGFALPSATNSQFFQANVSAASAGVYHVVLSNSFGSATSSVATVSVMGGAELRLLEFTNLWRFNISASNLGTAWRLPAYNDASWPSGRGVFWRTVSPDYPEPTNTAIPLVSASGNTITTYYFRVHFTLPAGLSNVILVSSNLLDDGAVFHLNGVEAGRIRLNGTVAYDTFADFGPSDGRAYETLMLSPTNLLAGDNVLAVEVHQTSGTSSDVTFGFQLRAYGAFPQALSILNQPASQTVLEGQPVVLTAAVFGGQPVSYQWYHNGQPLTAETNTAVQIPALHAAGTGNYFLIVSNSHGAVTSSVATLNMSADVTPPTLLLAQMTNGLSGVALIFSEPINPAYATNLAHYHFTPGLTIQSAQMLSPSTVLLTVLGLDLQVDYTVAVSSLFDLADAPNAIAPGTVALVRPDRSSPATGLLQVQTVFIIVMENVAWVDVKGSTNLPYLNSLLPLASYCENYTAPTNLHPSQPNYLWLEAGDHFGYVNDNGPASSRVASTNHLATQLFRAGIEWRGYMEDMPYGSVGITNAIPYLARHNPFAFFDDVTINYAYCTNHVRPYAELAGDLTAGRIGRYNFLIPNVTNDMHSFAPGSTSLAKQGDNWLARELPQILNSSAYSNNGAVFITWDENDFTENSAIGMVVLSPLARGGGYASLVPYDHSSTLRTMQEIFRVRPYLGAAANASPLNDLFKDFSLSVLPSNGVTSVRLDNALPGKTNYVQASSNLVNWTTLSTNVAAGPLTIPDPGAAGALQRFYRAIELP